MGGGCRGGTQEQLGLRGAKGKEVMLLLDEGKPERTGLLNCWGPEARGP